MRRLPAWCAALALAIWAPCAPSARAGEPGFARLSFAAGPSWDHAQSRPATQFGYGLDVGAEIGRPMALTLGAGIEHYPGAASYEYVDVYGNGHTYRVEVGGNKTILSGSVGLQVALEPDSGGIAVWVETGMGLVSAVAEGPRTTDLTLGTSNGPYGDYGDQLLMGYAGIGLRTHRRHGYDWSIGLRRRGYAVPFGEGGTNGASLQLRIGVVTP